MNHQESIDLRREHENKISKILYGKQYPGKEQGGWFRIYLDGYTASNFKFMKLDSFITIEDSRKFIELFRPDFGIYKDVSCIESCDYSYKFVWKNEYIAQYSGFVLELVELMKDQFEDTPQNRDAKNIIRILYEFKTSHNFLQTQQNKTNEK